MSQFTDAYVGHIDEVTYGTFLAPTGFNEFLSEGLSGKYERIESEAVRAGTQILRSDRWAVNPKGAEGDLKFEVLDVGFDFWLKHMLGSVTAAAPAGGFTTTTAKLGDLRGKSVSVKVGRVDNSGTLNPFDYAGGKVKSWEISNAVDGILNLSLDMDFATESTGGASATPTYSAYNSQLLTFAGGAATIDGAEFAVSDISVKGENALKVDRYAMRGGVLSTAKREPLVEGLRALSFDLKGEFDTMAHYNRVKSSTVAGALASVVLTWDSPQGGQLVVSMPFARFDEGAVNVDGAKVIDQSMTGKVLTDGSATEPFTIAYKAKSS